MKNVVVATDFSTRSDRAIRRGSVLAKVTNGWLTIIHVIDDDQPQALVDVEAAEVRKLLEAQTETLRTVDGIDAQYYVALGDPFQSIAQFAADYHSDVVILGPHRRQILKDVFIGTTAERTVRHSGAPVLMANGVPAAPYRHILVAVDLSDGSASAVRCAAQTEWGEKPALSVFYGYAPPEKIMRGAMGVSQADVDRYLAQAQARAEAELAVFLRPLNCRPIRQIVKMLDNEPASMILQAARDIGADLIVVGRSERSAISKLLLGSVSEAVLRRSDVDVLSVPTGWLAPSGTPG